MDKSLILGSLALLAIAQQAMAQEIDYTGRTLETEFSVGGYRVDLPVLATRVEMSGLNSCEGSQASRSIQNSMSVASKIDLEFKRKLFLALAKEFAGVKTPQEENIAKLIQSITFKGKQLDWCAGFALTMANLTDEIDGKNSVVGPNQVHDGNSLDYASANKLLEVFDPNYKPNHGDSRNAPAKKQGLFLGPDQQPVPGCLGVYLNPQTEKGHVVIVLSADGGTSGHIQTVEGNTPAPGSKASSTETNGVYSKVRTWGKGQVLEPGVSDVYQGCVLPWPGMAQQPKLAEVSCSNSKPVVSDNQVMQFIKGAEQAFVEAGQIYSEIESISGAMVR